MGISGVGISGSFFPSPASRVSPTGGTQNAGQSSAAGQTTSDGTATDPVAQDFLKIAKESPIQRMIDDWLKAHGLTEESLAKLPPDKQAAIRKEMAEDIKKEMEHQATSHRGKGAIADIVA